MVDFWAVIGLSVIDENFYHAIVDNLNDPDLVGVKLAGYNFRLSRYEVGEIIRVYRRANVRAGIELVQSDIWVHVDEGPDSPCWTGSAISGLNKPGADHVYLHGYFEKQADGTSELMYSQLSAIPHEPDK